MTESQYNFIFKVFGSLLLAALGIILDRYSDCKSANTARITDPYGIVISFIILICALSLKRDSLLSANALLWLYCSYLFISLSIKCFLLIKNSAPRKSIVAKVFSRICLAVIIIIAMR